MIAEEKLKTLAQQSTALQAYFGNPAIKFRWEFLQLPQGLIPKRPGDQAFGGGTSSARIQRISTLSNYVQEGPNPLERIRFQVDVYDLNAIVAFNAANAVINWFGTINLVTGQQFGSPVTTPNQFPSIQSNLRPGVDVQAGTLIYVWSIDEWVYNNTQN